MPRVCWSHWNSMTWVNLERIYKMKATLGFEWNPKESTRATNFRCTLLSQLSLGFSHELLLKWVFFSNEQVRNSGFFFLSYICIFLTITSVCGFHSRIPTKKQISHSLIHMGFIGLVMWSRVRGIWKKGLDRLKECLRVILSKNLKSVLLVPFVHFNFWVGLYSFCLVH